MSSVSNVLLLAALGPALYASVAAGAAHRRCAGASTVTVSMTLPVTTPETLSTLVASSAVSSASNAASSKVTGRHSSAATSKASSTLTGLVAAESSSTTSLATSNATSLSTTGRVAVSGTSTATSISASSTAAASTEDYSEWTVSAIDALQNWYDEDEGLWLSTGWWNSANCLTMLGDFYAADASDAETLDLSTIFSTTFTQAQTSGSSSKLRRKVLMPQAAHHAVRRGGGSGVSALKLADRGYTGFLNDYYDDEGWWALAWIRAYDVTGTTEYLTMAESIFSDMEAGVNNTCGGGIWWSKDETYKNAIANELYLAVAASLANRASSADTYLSIAEGQWTWFQNSGMINSDNLINDGLTINSDGTCVNNGETIWSYNQGVILGGLLELYKANGNASLVTQAVTIAEAAIDALSVDGILHESCEGSGCGGDVPQFKGKLREFNIDAIYTTLHGMLAID